MIVFAHEGVLHDGIQRLHAIVPDRLPALDSADFSRMTNHAALFLSAPHAFPSLTVLRPSFPLLPLFLSFSERLTCPLALAVLGSAQPFFHAPDVSMSAVPSDGP